MSKILLIGIIIFSTILSGQEITLLIEDDEIDAPTGDSIEILLRGEKEYCILTLNTDGSYGKSDCLSIKNSKGISIVCTKNKNLCKTKDEIFNYVSKKLSTSSIESKPSPKIKKKQILDVSDVILDFKELKSKKICVKGDITAINDMVSLSDSATNSLNSIHLDVSNLNRETRKDIMTKCELMSDNCKEITLCGTVKTIFYSKGLLVNEIK